jgi:hypothetical protein
MTRDKLLTELRELAIAAGWTGQDLGHLRGRWAREATLEQLQACRDALWDASADTVTEWDEPADQTPAVAAVLDNGCWLLDALYLSTLPLANFPTTAERVTNGEERALRNAARFGLLRDRSKLDKIAAWKAETLKAERLDAMERITHRRAG